MQRLHNLNRFDAGSLSKLPALRSLATDWQPNLGQIVCTAVQSIRRLSVHVNRPRLVGTLVDGCGPKLESVAITGPSLRYVDPRALVGLERGAGERLMISIRHTAIEDLPADLLLPLVGVPKLTLDLASNKLTSLNPLTVYSNYTTWENSGTNILKGEYRRAVSNRTSSRRTDDEKDLAGGQVFGGEKKGASSAVLNLEFLI